jgi:hypothetical protein
VYGYSYFPCYSPKSGRRWEPMTKNATSFKKGHDARRYLQPNTGVTEFYQKMGQLFRNAAPEALDYALSVMKDESADPKLRYASCIEILNRGAGKPVDRTIIATLEQGGKVDPSTLSDAELLKLIDKNDDDNDIIEGNFTESL